MKPMPSILRVTDPISRKGRFSPPAAAAAPSLLRETAGRFYLGLWTSGWEAGESPTGGESGASPATQPVEPSDLGAESW